MVHNAAAILESSLRKHEVSPNGIKYLKMVLDPFHDANLEIVGAPDSATGSSLVHDFRKDISLSSPDPTVEENWDCHIAFIPLIRSDNYNSRADYDDYGAPCFLMGPASTQAAADTIVLGDEDTPQLPNGCFVACCVPAGLNTFDPNAPEAVYHHIPFDDTLLANDVSSRIIGGAFEVHNTSAQMFRQGASICYRQEAEIPNTGLMHSVYFNSQNERIDNNATPIYPCTAPPTSFSDAKPLAGITQEASRGALVPLTFDVHENPARLPTLGNWMIQTSLYKEGVWPQSHPNYKSRQVWTNKSLFKQPAAAFKRGPSGPGIVYTELESQSEVPKLKVIPFNQAGCYLSGLHFTNTLNLSVRMFIETFPKAGNADLSLVRPSPTFDGPALDALSYAFSDLLSGYPVSMNAKGDYFRMVGQSINKRYGDQIRQIKKCATDVAKGVVSRERDALEKSLTGMANLTTIKSKAQKRF